MSQDCPLLWVGGLLSDTADTSLEVSVLGQESSERVRESRVVGTVAGGPADCPFKACAGGPQCPEGGDPPQLPP